MANLKEMQERGKKWNEEHKSEVYYDRRGLVRFESLTKQNQELLKEEESIKYLWKISIAILILMRLD